MLSFRFLFRFYRITLIDLVASFLIILLPHLALCAKGPNGALMVWFECWKMHNKASIRATTLHLSPQCYPNGEKKFYAVTWQELWSPSIWFSLKKKKNLLLRFLLNWHQTCSTASADCPPQTIQADFLKKKKGPQSRLNHNVWL